MTHDDPEPDSAAAGGYFDIDALLDGETVSKENLRFALDDTAARDYLIDALLLRQVTHEMGPAHFVAPGVPRSPLARAVRWIAASLILAVGVGGGYAYGLQAQPPTPSRASFEVVVDTTPPPAAPEPTRIIRFEPGVNWTTSTEEN